MCSPTRPAASRRWIVPIPRALRSDRPMRASPKKVMARTTPATMVTPTKARPANASAVPTTTNQSSDQVRLVKGVRRIVRAISLTRLSSSSETTITISMRLTRLVPRSRRSLCFVAVPAGATTRYTKATDSRLSREGG